MDVDFTTKFIIVGLAGKSKYGRQLYSSKCPMCLRVGVWDKYQLMRISACQPCSHTIHGHHKSKIYNKWVGMHNRCSNPKNASYNDYGGRGISVCSRWNDVNVFMSDMGECPDGYQLDRIDNNGNYEPGNCRWASRVDNMRNRRTTAYININGQSKLAKEWAAVSGLKLETINSRIRRGYTGESIIQPVKDTK